MVSDEMGAWLHDRATRELQEQIDAVLARIVSVSEQIQKLAYENKSLKSDIARFHKQLSKKSLTRSA